MKTNHTSETNILEAIFFDDRHHWDRFVKRCLSRKWAELQTKDKYKSVHRQVVLTIDEGL